MSHPLSLSQAKWASLLADELASVDPDLTAVAMSDEGLVLGVLILRTAEGGTQTRGWLAPYTAAARTGGLATAARLAARDLILPETVAHGELLIEYLCVSPAARRRGVAAALLTEAAARAEGGKGGKGAGGGPLSRLSLWVAASNTGAIALYAKAGFKVTQTTAETGWVARAACAAFLGETAWLRMEREVVKKAPSLLTPPPTPPLASDRPESAAAVVGL